MNRPASAWGTSRRRARALRWLLPLSGLFLLTVLCAWLLIARMGDRWWFATLLMFGPRWVWALPALILLPVALWLRRWHALGLQLLALLVVVWPLMGWRWVMALPDPESSDLRVVSFNMGNSDYRAQHRVTVQELRRLFDDTRADLLMIQECRFDQETLRPAFADVALHISAGSCAISRRPILRVDTRERADVRALGGSGMIDRLELQTPGGPISVVNVHLESVRDGMARIIERAFFATAAMESNASLRRLESAVAGSWAARSDLPLLVLGDFNMPVESAIYRRYWAVLGNAFDDCGRGYGHTKFERGYGIRIDHVLYDRRWRCVAASIDDSTGGDHRPLVVDLRLEAARG